MWVILWSRAGKLKRNLGVEEHSCSFQKGRCRMVWTIGGDARNGGALISAWSMCECAKCYSGLCPRGLHNLWRLQGSHMRMSDRSQDVPQGLGKVQSETQKMSSRKWCHRAGWVQRLHKRSMKKCSVRGRRAPTRVVCWKDFPKDFVDAKTSPAGEESS